MSHHPDPRNHSAEHILNQTMVRLYDCGRCFNAHIGNKKSKLDYHFGHALTQDEVTEIQSRVNDVIAADMPVTASYVSKIEAFALYDTGKLPDDTDEEIRIIHIGDYDACPCIGKHVKSTSEIGSFRITTTTYQDGVLRIRFKLA
jgi:misacylated tRNA(Ala) deacylase